MDFGEALQMAVKRAVEMVFDSVVVLVFDPDVTKDKLLAGLMDS